MKKSRFTETQIIRALKENESGRKIEDISRELGKNNVMASYHYRSEKRCICSGR